MGSLENVRAYNETMDALQATGRRIVGATPELRAAMAQIDAGVAAVRELVEGRALYGTEISTSIREIEYHSSLINDRIRGANHLTIQQPRSPA